MTRHFAIIAQGKPSWEQDAADYLTSIDHEANILTGKQDGQTAVVDVLRQIAIRAQAQPTLFQCRQ